MISGGPFRPVHLLSTARLLYLLLLTLFFVMSFFGTARWSDWGEDRKMQFYSRCTKGCADFGQRHWIPSRRLYVTLDDSHPRSFSPALRAGNVIFICNSNGRPGRSPLRLSPRLSSLFFAFFFVLSSYLASLNDRPALSAKSHLSFRRKTIDRSKLRFSSRWLCQLMI